MRKLIIAALAVGALTIASCGNKTATPAGTNDSVADTTQVDTTALAPETKSTLNALTSQLTEAIKNKDGQALTTALANMAASYKVLVNSGKLQDALSYGKVVKDFVAKNADTIKSFTGNNTAVSSLLSGIQNLPTDASTTADQAKQAVSSNLVNMASSALQKAAATGATAEAAAAALQNLPSSVSDAAKAAVNGATGAAKEAAAAKVDAAQSAVTDAKEAAKAKAADAVNKSAEKASNAVNDAASKAAAKAVKGLGL